MVFFYCGGATMKAIKITTCGGPDVLKLTDTEPKPAPGTGQALVRIHAAGVNFVDIYQRRGTYPVNLPYIPGLEASGVVEAIGQEGWGFSWCSGRSILAQRSAGRSRPRRRRLQPKRQAPIMWSSIHNRIL